MPGMGLAKDNAVFPKDRLVRVSDGTPIAYTVRGDGPGTPVVFLNGWTCSDGYWAGIGPGVVAAGHRAVFLDTRGHGESGLPRPPGFHARNLTAADVSVSRVASDIIEVLDDADIPTAVLSGHSMGVQALFEAYRQSPERVAALIPIAGTYENPVKSFADLPVLDRLYPIADVLFRQIPFELLGPLMRRTANPDVGLRVVKLIHVAGPKVTAQGLAPHMGQIGELNFSVLWRMMSEMRLHSAAAVLPTVSVPTLVLAGRNDLFTPPSVQQRMADLIPGSEIHWWEEAGHMLPLEEPAEVTAAIVDFLRRRLPDHKPRRRSAAATGPGRGRARTGDRRPAQPT
jgi:pimeloyl-ACP methyl ester carboxylesterase